MKRTNRTGAEVDQLKAFWLILGGEGGCQSKYAIIIIIIIIIIMYYFTGLLQNRNQEN